MEKTEGQMLESIYDDMQEVKRQVKDLQLTLENETNRNIKLIAEGHLDLNRKLDEVFKIENEVRQLRERVEGIA